MRLNESAEMTLDPTLPGSSHRFAAFCAPIVERLNTRERAAVYAICRAVTEVAATAGFDVHNPYATFYDAPDRDDVPLAPWEDRDRVLASDLVIHLSHYPARASGTGESWDYAFRANVPQLILGRGPAPSRRLMTWTTAPKYETEYVGEESLRDELAATLMLLRPFLSERRNRTAGASGAQLASRVRRRRDHLNLSREQLVAAANLDLTLVTAIENDAAGIDPPLSTMQDLAIGLKLTLAELVDVIEGTPRLHDVD